MMTVLLLLLFGIRQVKVAACQAHTPSELSSGISFTYKGIADVAVVIVVAVAFCFLF